MIVAVPELIPCVVQTYRDDDGGWWRYCLTCDDGSNKYGRHRRGHRTEDDARQSARDHAKAAPKVRQWRQWRASWRAALAACDDWPMFCALMGEHPTFGHARDWSAEVDRPNPEVMRMIQEVQGGDLITQIVVHRKM